MTNVAHSTLTGADLHEPKGVASATSGAVYVANGFGSGTWTDANSIITNSAWSTGDAKLTLVTSAPSGWILVNDGTIGDGSSLATTRAASDTSALFTLLWNLPIGLTVSGGRGASAALDYAAHKTIQVPLFLGRVLGVAGSGAGLTTRAVGANVGAETVILAQSGLPNVVLTFTGSASTVSGALSLSNGFAGGVIIGGTGSGIALTTTIGTGVATTATGTISSLNGNVTQTSTSIMQPSSFLNLLIKL